jgi:hypothetical protein
VENNRPLMLECFGNVMGDLTPCKKIPSVAGKSPASRSSKKLQDRSIGWSYTPYTGQDGNSLNP